MSRNLKRVPLDFSWPLNKTWDGYLNPYCDLAVECPDCYLGYDCIGGRPDANAALFYEQWYARAPFDPIAYGAEPLSPDHPRIWDIARHNVNSAPAFYMTAAERAAERKSRQKAIGDHMDALHKTTEELKAELDRPAGDLEVLEQPGLLKIESFREPAVAREAKRLHGLWCNQWCHHLIQADVDALVEAGRLPDFTHRPRSPAQVEQLKAQAQAGGSGCWLEEPNGYHPTAAEVNAWSLGGMGHDAINHGVCVEARCAREGVPSTCARCAGSAKIWPTPDIQKQCDEWEPTEPPTGDGYQLWQDCSEGSPVSPVFTTLDDLCAWAADHEHTFAAFKATAEEWKKMLESNFVHHREGANVYL